jgi:hypothetical protein
MVQEGFCYIIAGMDTFPFSARRAEVVKEFGEK